MTEETSLSFGKTVNEVKEEKELENLEKPTSEEASITKYAINTSEFENKKSMNNEANNITEEENTNTNVNVNVSETILQKEEIKNPSFKKPVEGEIIREFAKEKLVYSNTLGEWITHNGIDIKADKTSVVKSAEEGIVKSIKNDPRYGLTVVVEHNSGFTTIYANLLTAEFVVEGEKIKQGQTIGTVGNTASFEIMDESHLHFEMMKDGEYLDPELYIKE